MVKSNLMDWMPEYYKGENTKAIQDARQIELEGAESGQKKIIDDMYVSTATDIGLWENEYGIKDSGASLLQRQQNMLAYIRGGGGAITKDMILAVVNSYTGTDESELVELSDENTIRIKCKLSPSSSFSKDDLIATLYKMIQAHVGVIVDSIWNYEADSTIGFGFKYRGGYTKAPIIRT